MRSPARSPVAGYRGRPYDRHNASGLRGLPKKKGAGSKGVWGAPMDQEPVMILDKNDPNYDSEDDIYMPYMPLPAISISLPIPAPSKVSGMESLSSSPVEKTHSKVKL